MRQPAGFVNVSVPSNDLQPLSCTELLGPLIDPSEDAMTSPLHEEQQQQHEIIGVLIHIAMPAKLQGKALISAMRLACGHRMADAVLPRHGVFCVVLPSTAGGLQHLPQPKWLAGLHAHMYGFNQQYICAWYAVVKSW